MKLKKIYLLFLLIPLLSFTTHKYYLSLTQIEYSSEKKSIQIIMNVFMDDIEYALNEEYAIDLQLTTKDELKNNNTYFNKYLSENLQLKVNDSLTKFNYIGKEYEGDLVYFYLEIEDIPSIKTIEVTNTVLVKNYEKQQNLIKAKVDKKYKSVMLSKNNDKGLLKF
ncbi:hypothetical protein OD91_2703 [Lutibacter sp. Hel_I_33_5]|uniref:DUF6702 family protein n=1 Tax=Lutibacter sp. Hel_I_33_5 TaxID=1566289 RepID=UPI0011A9FBFE|nr:DUF6702 family protein [Lutibacter sp. Hel_I_33_5]TVZ57382.1 hypothetical protein OD91_2703 [Lutibacter sp. Hel_I_33_5]